MKIPQTQALEFPRSFINCKILTQTSQFVLPVGAIEVTIAKSFLRNSISARARGLVTRVVTIHQSVAPLRSIYASFLIIASYHIKRTRSRIFYRKTKINLFLFFFYKSKNLNALQIRIDFKYTMKRIFF